MRLPLGLRGFCGAIAQLGERNTGSVEVVGSIPSGSTNIINLKRLYLPFSTTWELFGSRPIFPAVATWWFFWIESFSSTYLGGAGKITTQLLVNLIQP